MRLSVQANALSNMPFISSFNSSLCSTFLWLEALFWLCFFYNFPGITTLIEVLLKGLDVFNPFGLGCLFFCFYITVIPPSACNGGGVTALLSFVMSRLIIDNPLSYRGSITVDTLSSESTLHFILSFPSELFPTLRKFMTINFFL